MLPQLCFLFQSDSELLLLCGGYLVALSLVQGLLANGSGEEFLEFCLVGSRILHVGLHVAQEGMRVAQLFLEMES